MKLKKAVWALLPDDLKKAFKPVLAEGQEEADAEEYDNGEEEAGGLKSALDKERAALKALRDEKKAADEGKTAAELEAAKKKGDMDALEKSWQGKLDKSIAEKDALIKTKEEALSKILVGSVARELATKISTVPDLLTDFIAKRLGVDLDGDMPKTRVLDGEGKPSALSLEDLGKEIVADKRFAGIIKANGSSGGGAGDGKPGAGGFKLDSFKKKDGSIDWGKVNTANQKDPTTLKQVQDAMLADARGGAAPEVTE